jgi:LysR family transcriptional regulator, glycine cleavage system transcriptional activator
MPKSLPPLTWFRAFEAAARHLSFTLAAEELGFTQSAISQHVRALEERLECQLFLRRHRALQLTDAGRLLVPDVAAAMARLESAAARFQPVTARAKLTIATSASIAHRVLAPNLSRFHAAHPDIALQITTTVWPDDFTATNADIEIRFGAEAMVGHKAELIAPSYLHAVASPALFATLPDPLRWADLAQVALIQPVGLSTGWPDLAAVSPPLEALIYVDTHGLAADMALHGAGVALCHCQITQHAIESGQLVALDLVQCPAEEGYYLAIKPSSLPREQAAFSDWFRSLSGG